MGPQLRPATSCCARTRRCWSPLSTAGSISARQWHSNSRLRSIPSRAPPALRRRLTRARASPHPLPPSPIGGKKVNSRRRRQFHCQRSGFWLLRRGFRPDGASCEKSHGSSEEESLQIPPQHAPCAPCAEGGELCRMLELRRNEAPSSPLRGLRPLRWPRGGGERGRDGVSRRAPPVESW